MSKFIDVTLESNRERVVINADHIIFIEDGAYGTSKLNMLGGQSLIVLESLEQIEAQLFRDEFAIHVASGLIAISSSAGEQASNAYALADAMLKERMK